MSAALTDTHVDRVLAELDRDDVLGQLVQRRRRMALLGSEAGRVRLDWADAMWRWLDDAGAPARLELLVESVLGDAARLLWSGMGGSVMAVRAMLDLGLLAHAPVSVLPLDSTDPRALNDILDQLGTSAAALAVSMGLTSEEPVSHLRWLGTLSGRGAPRVRRAVMTIPGSTLEDFARRCRLARVSVQPDGNDGTPGRMSAPGTHVFLLPAILALGGGAAVRAALREAQAQHGIGPDLGAVERSRLVREHPAVRLACMLHLHLRAGRTKALLVDTPGSAALAPWVEQLVEESLGKRGGGLLVFAGQDAALLADPPDDCFLLRLDEAMSAGWRPDGVAEVAAFFAAWSLAVAVLGHLEGITFVGQPAVEGYKRHARLLRDADTPPRLPAAQPPAPVVERARQALRADRTGYLDVTLNAAASTPGWPELAAAARRFANRGLGRPAKLRVAPAHYHSTEQMQVDGVPGVHSIRVAIRDLEAVRMGEYGSAYIHAQALGAAQAMAEAGRPVDLVACDDAAGLRELATALA